MVAMNASPMTPDELRDILAQLDLTAAEAAAILGVNRATVASWSIGRRPLSGPAALLLRLMSEARSIIKDDVRDTLRAHIEAIE